MGCCNSLSTTTTTTSTTSSDSGGPSNQTPVQNKGERTYVKLQVLGHGASCRVLAVKNSAGLMFAMKIMDKSVQLNKTLFENEVKILKLLKHPNILEYVESFEDDKAYNIVTVLCRGGDLFDKVQHGSFTEKVAARLTFQMATAVAECHKRSIVHRDIKPENFVFETKKDDSPMKLIDFGCALVAKDDEVVKDLAGSPYYVAPEVLENVKRTGKTWKAADMWSVGVILYLFCFGYPPFNGHSQDKIFAAIRRGRYKFPQNTTISPQACDLITKLLLMNPDERLTAEQVLAHPWISAAPDVKIEASIIKSIAAFRSHCRLRKAVGRVLANHMTDEDQQHLQQIFSQFDTNRDGQLGPSEIAAMLKSINSPESVAEFMKQVDVNSDGAINLPEMAAVLAAGKLSALTPTEMKQNFDQADRNKDGYVSQAELEKFLNLKPEEVKLIIEDVDTNGDGRVSIEEWIAAMKDMTRLSLKLNSLSGKR